MSAEATTNGKAASSSSDSATNPNVAGPPKELQFVKIDGVSFPKSPRFLDYEKHIKELRNFEMLPDDIVLCAFRKAGTHWTWEIVKMLLRGKAEYTSDAKEALMMDLVPVEELSANASPRVFNTHFTLHFLPRQIREKRTKVIFVSRNPKDVAVSLYHHSKGLTGPLKFEGNFEEYLSTEFFSPKTFVDWFSYEKEWEKALANPDINAIRLVYEDMKEDLVSNVERLAEFLGTGASKELCQQIAEACGFQNMQAADKTMVKPENKRAFLKTRIYRKGEVGDWKNWFTVTQSEMFDQVYAERMKDSKLTFRYTL